MMNKRIIYMNILKQVSIVLLICCTTSVSANVGRVIYGYGSNYAIDSDGNRRDMKKGAVIREGDTLVTGKGRMQVRLIDGGFISIYPQSEYKIEKFKYTETNKEDGNDSFKRGRDSKENKGFFSLLRGAARQVTGVLGRTYKENFKFKTSVATIGIRGTGFFARLCQADCFDAQGNPMQDGMYVKNNIGVITMTTNAGDVALAQGQSAFAASSEDVPEQIIQPPLAYNVATPDIQLYDFDQKVVGGNIDPDAELPPVIPPVIPPVTPPAVAVVNLEYVTNTSKSVSTPLDGLDTANPTDSVQQSGDEIQHFETEIFIAGVGLVPVVFDQGSAVLAESGTDTTLGVLWNRWSGSYTHTQNGTAVVSLDNNMHVIGSELLTQNLPASGVVNYESTGGTSPTFDGATGAQVGTQFVTATIDFEVMEVMALDIDATFSDATINASLTNTSGNFISGASGNVYSVSGPCVDTGGCGANGLFVSGEASVNFVGTQAEGIYGIYSLSSGTGENAVSGSYLATEVQP